MFSREECCNTNILPNKWLSIWESRSRSRSCMWPIFSWIFEKNGLIAGPRHLPCYILKFSTGGENRGRDWRPHRGGQLALCQSGRSTSETRRSGFHLWQNQLRNPQRSSHYTQRWEIVEAGCDLPRDRGLFGKEKTVFSDGPLSHFSFFVLFKQQYNLIGPKCK